MKAMILGAYKHSHEKRARLQTSKTRRVYVEVMVTPGVLGGGYLAEACVVAGKGYDKRPFPGRSGRSCYSKRAASPTTAVSKALRGLSAKLSKR